MILEALKVLLFGMLGIFFVMGTILLSVKIMSSFGRNIENQNEQEEENEDEN